MTGLQPPAGGLRQIRRAVLILYGIVALLVLVAVFAFFANRQSTEALCALRGDLERRVSTSEEFLREHPNGIAGISARDIQDGIDNQQRTITALSGLSCPK